MYPSVFAFGINENGALLVFWLLHVENKAPAVESLPWFWWI